MDVPQLCCPQCGSRKVRFSKPQLLEHALGLLQITPYRCRGCRYRFYGFRRNPGPIEAGSVGSAPSPGPSEAGADGSMLISPHGRSV